MAKNKNPGSRTPPPDSPMDDDDFGAPPPAAAPVNAGKSKRNLKPRSGDPSGQPSMPAQGANAKPGRPQATAAMAAAGKSLTTAMTVPGRSMLPGRQVINMDKRDLTKKQVTQLAEWRGENRGKALDKYIAAQNTRARAKFGHSSVMVASEYKNLIVGIPCPSLAFEYLIANDVFPLGLIMSLVGPHGSNKSALAFEIFRWFELAGGFGRYMEVETKFSPELLESIVVNYDNFPVDRCASVEDWQRRLMFYTKEEKRALTGTKEEPGPGRTIPIALVVDTIMGKASIETQEKVAAAGHGNRSFPLEALQITQFLKTFPHQLDEWPFALILNNQLKIGKDEDGKEQRRLSGGQGVGFQESFEIETRVNRQQLTCADWDGNQVSLRCTKNAFGPTWRRIDTRMLWWQELKEAGLEVGVPENWRQRTVWDWDWATIKLLSTRKGREKAMLDEVGFHLTTPTTSDVENTAWSKNLGMKAEDAKSWTDVGRMIAQDTKVKDMVRTALAINRRPLMAGDYLQQLEGLREQLP